MFLSRYCFVSALALSLLTGAIVPPLLSADLPPELAAPQKPGAGEPQEPRLLPSDAFPKSKKQHPQADTAEADRELREIVADQKAVFAAAEAAGDKFDPDNFRSQMQQITQRYDRLLRINGNYVAGYVAYGLLLDKIGMGKDGAALMYKANQLDDSIAIVKNQLGNFCAEEGRPLEAFVFYNAAIALEPKEPLYYYQLGTLLAEGRETFLKNAPGMWTREKIDDAMQAAFQQATELAPGDWRYAYRYGLSFYDLQTGEWEAALQFWETFEKKLKPGIEQQVCRLHQAKVLGELRRIKDAQARLDTVTAPELMTQKMPVALQIDALRKKATPDQSDEAANAAREEEKDPITAPSNEPAPAQSTAP